MNKDTYIIAFESSCDDTTAAVIDAKGTVLSDVSFSQGHIHSPYGGVVPEIGSRSHIEQILLITNQAMAKARTPLSKIDAVAATFAPGLLGPLLVSAQFAKGLALALNKPLIAVHHIVGHILAGFLEENFPKPPFIALVVSGGHTALYLCQKDYSFVTLGQTLDDAAGEAFDKIGRVCGFSYPCGAEIDKMAEDGSKERFLFSVPLKGQDNFNFSFSGLKSQSLRLIEKHAKFDEQSLKDFCAGLRETICISLVEKTILACKKYDKIPVVLAGGVAANSRLRFMLSEACFKENIEVYLTPKQFCTDNAVMIAKAGLLRYLSGKRSPLTQEVYASLAVEREHILYKT